MSEWMEKTADPQVTFFLFWESCLFVRSFLWLLFEPFSSVATTCAADILLLSLGDWIRLLLQKKTYPTFRTLVFCDVLLCFSVWMIQISLPQVVSREAVVLVLVGLPARGKSFICGAVVRCGRPGGMPRLFGLKKETFAFDWNALVVWPKIYFANYRQTCSFNAEKENLEVAYLAEETGVHQRFSSILPLTYPTGAVFGVPDI